MCKSVEERLQHLPRTCLCFWWLVAQIVGSLHKSCTNLAQMVGRLHKSCTNGCTNVWHRKQFAQFWAPRITWSDLRADELEARELVEEVLKRAGPRLERLPPPPPSLFAWLLVKGLVEPLLRIPNELPIEDSLDPGRRIFEGVTGSTEPPLSNL